MCICINRNLLGQEIKLEQFIALNPATSACEKPPALFSRREGLRMREECWRKPAGVEESSSGDALGSPPGPRCVTSLFSPTPAAGSAGTCRVPRARGILCFPSTPPARGVWDGTGNGGCLEALQHQQLPRSSVTSRSRPTRRTVLGISPAPRGVGDAVGWLCRSSSPVPVPPPSSPAFPAAPLSHALGLGATRRGRAAAALAEGFGYSCTVHVWGRMETADLAPCLPSVLF